ncbi:MAG: PqqD family protein [Ignisphaera sp.]
MEETSTKTRWNETYRKKGVEFGVEGGEFLVAADEEKIYALAPVVYYVWSKCDGETTVGSIVEELTEYVEDANKDVVYNAVVDIIDRLVEVGLLEKS